MLTALLAVAFAGLALGATALSVECYLELCGWSAEPDDPDGTNPHGQDRERRRG